MRLINDGEANLAIQKRYCIRKVEKFLRYRSKRFSWILVQQQEFTSSIWIIYKYAKKECWILYVIQSCSRHDRRRHIIFGSCVTIYVHSFVNHWTEKSILSKAQSARFQSFNKIWLIQVIKQHQWSFHSYLARLQSISLILL